MKIKKISKKKGSLYELLLDTGEKINLYDDVILKYELLLKKEIDDSKLAAIINFNSYLESYYKALKYINAKLRTEKEIETKLKDYEQDAINYTIERLKKEGLLNKELYIKAYINDEVNLKMVGPSKILYNLKKLGFDENDINSYLMTFEEDIWLNKIRKYMQRKINNNKNLSAKMIKIKLINDLKNKGFYKEQINEIINEFTFQDNHEVYEKEYQKVKNKLCKKFTDKDLEYQIKIKMLQKGFKS